MKKLMIIVLFGIILTGCKKELTFEEYYSCEKEYKATLDNLAELLKNKTISAQAYASKVTEAEKVYNQCLADGENNKK